MKEKWKPLRTYEGLYEISNTGKIRSIPRVITESTTGKTQFRKGRLMKTYINESGYEVVRLTRNGKSRVRRVHQLVIMTFSKWDIQRTAVNHKDGNKLNNSIDNLEWCTASENMRHAVLTHLRTYDSICRRIRIKIDDIDKVFKSAKHAAKYLHVHGYFVDVKLSSLSAAMKNSAAAHYRYKGILKAEFLDDTFDDETEYHKCGIKNRKIQASVNGMIVVERGPARLAKELKQLGYFPDKTYKQLTKSLSEAAINEKSYKGVAVKYL